MNTYDINLHTMHPELANLSARVKVLDHEAACMYNATSSIAGMGFFPSAWGGVDPVSAIHGRPFMVLGQDQDNMRGLSQSLSKGYETYSPSWRNLLALLVSAGIAPDECFFTNFIMGVRRDSDRNTGPSPALAHPVFMRACADFFLEQLNIQQPAVIITLGMVPFQLLALVSTDLRYRALGIKEFEAVDARGLHVISNVVFDDVRRTTTTVVPICHPCQPQNGRRRSFRNTTQHAGEAAMLKYVLETYVPSAGATESL